MADQAESQTRTERAIAHLKNHPNLYTILCVLSALVGIYADYRATVGPIEDSTETIEEKSVDAEAERVRQDEAMQKNLKAVLEYSLSIENRLTVLETKLERLEQDNTSFWQLILGKKTESSSTVAKEKPESDVINSATMKLDEIKSPTSEGAGPPRLDLQFPEQKVYFGAD